jgi:hypothetical protein
MVKVDKWSRRRYAVLKSILTGEYKVVDLFEKRLVTMRMRIYAWSRIMTVYCAEKNLDKIMVGFTYAPGKEYSPGHMRDYLKKIKQMLGKDLIGFAWVCEVQKRGAMHYHLMLCVTKGTRIPMPDKTGMWGFGSTSVAKARSFYYICSYIGKEYQKDLSRYPRSCRLYGASIRGDKMLQDTFRELSGIKRSSDTYTSEFSFVGACVTEGYTKVLERG